VLIAVRPNTAIAIATYFMRILPMPHVGDRTVSRAFGSTL
jgi:hypothetical protein